MELKVPPPLYMALSGLLMWLLKSMTPGLVLDSGFVAGLGILLMLVGFSFDVWAFMGFVRSKTTVNPLKPESSNALVTDQLYRFTRNPMYLGMAFILVGWALYLGSLLSLVFLPLFISVITRFQIIPEERALETLFGEAFVQYKAEVRRWI